MSSPLKVGITGGIGTGKSIISRIFSVLEIPIYDADSSAKWLMNNEPSIRKKVIDLFGARAYNEKGLDRTWISSQTFNNKDKLSQLNALVHPAVGRDYMDWVRSSTSPYTIKEAALLYESGSYKQLDKVIVVSAPEELRIERVLKRDSHRKKGDIEAIIKNQWPQQKKVEVADLTIINDGQSMVIPQVLSIHEKLLAESVSKLAG